MDSKKILSANLKQYRAKHKLSQEELAARAELSTRGYGKIERAEVHSSLKPWINFLVGQACHRRTCYRSN